ncbi:MAG: tetratricopeptide repeat protein [Rhodoplanes sp.]|uniref:tetratricopeptide repeat protein n=1 Tax=Rhodoplanes sp. TaxID=1968906 RepID=UPI0017F41963|nr:tetratricopeptide repeat protein [Rhodoplanes sp.]NVO12737.1 tetratricopeptide repeat protein [Rhodoplanes sp.]
MAVATAAARADAVNRDALALIHRCRLDAKEFDAAAAAAAALVALAPASAEAHVLHGQALAGAGRLAEALASFDAAIVHDARYAGAWIGRGAVLCRTGRPADGLQAFDRALAVAPGASAALVGRGNALVDLDRPAEALAAFDRVLRADPADGSALVGRANALAGLGRRGEALATYERALAAAPDLVDALIGQGLVLRDLDRPDDAEVGLAQALARDPGRIDAWLGRALALCDLHRQAEAVTCLERAVAIDPGRADAQFVLAVVRLQRGDLAAGWAGYEWRWSFGQARRDGVTPIPPPTVRDPAALRGRSVLLVAEQGLGDTLQFFRYAPLLAAAGAHVTVAVHPPLAPLLAAADPSVTVTAQGPALPPADHRLALLSLPLVFGTTLDRVPAAVPYVRSDPSRVAAWRARLGPPDRLRVAVAWSGNPANADDRRRSIPLHDLAPLLDRDVAWLAVQKDLRPADAEVAAARPGLRLLGPELRDFADTAAVLDLVDLVVAVDTGVVHLAGAMGRPVWVLLPFNPDWRWLLDRADSPWYPTARLFRQSARGDWTGVIRDVGAALDRLATARRAARFGPCLEPQTKLEG